MWSVVSLFLYIPARHNIHALSETLLSLPKCCMDVDISHIIWMNSIIFLQYYLNLALAYNCNSLKMSSLMADCLFLENGNKISFYNTHRHYIGAESTLRGEFQFSPQESFHKQKTWTLRKHLQNETDDCFLL